jgi:hypothetical protein
MKPLATKLDLPSGYDVKVHIHNECVQWLQNVKKDILVSAQFHHRVFPNSPKLVQAAPKKISVTADGWTADNTRGSFLGMTAHWIDVDSGKWRLRSEVVGFQGLSGNHSGSNLGRYFVGLCDRVGITSPDESKVIDKLSDATAT